MSYPNGNSRSRLGLGSPDNVDLLAGRALGDLSLDETSTLASVPRLVNRQEADGLEAAVGSIYLAASAGWGDPDARARMVVAVEPVPEDVISRLRRLAEAFIAASAISGPGGTAGAASDRTPEHERASRAPGRPWGLVALAASVLIAGAGVALSLRAGAAGQKHTASAGQLLTQVRLKPDAVTLQWGAWSDESVQAELTGVTGEVVWSDQAQTGVMRLANLPFISGTVYQLWIIDAERGMAQRVSGAIFQGGSREAFVPIEPRLSIGRAAAFAITIEQPGGTWVSDMTRRVVIAARPG